MVILPWNCWRHLAAKDKTFALEPWKVPLYGLWCLKPVHGLNDAPVAWQLSLGQFLKKNKGTHSHLDDSFFFWKDAEAFLASSTRHTCGRLSFCWFWSILGRPRGSCPWAGKGKTTQMRAWPHG